MNDYIEKNLEEIISLARKHNKSYEEAFEDYKCLYKRKYDKELRIKKEGKYINKFHYFYSSHPLKNISMYEFNAYYMPKKTIKLMEKIYNKK